MTSSNPLARGAAPAEVALAAAALIATPTCTPRATCKANVKASVRVLDCCASASVRPLLSSRTSRFSAAVVESSVFGVVTHLRGHKSSDNLTCVHFYHSWCDRRWCHWWHYPHIRCRPCVSLLRHSPSSCAGFNGDGHARHATCIYRATVPVGLRSGLCIVAIPGAVVHAVVLSQHPFVCT